MEDSVIESERLEPSLTLNQREEDGQEGEAKEVEEEGEHKTSGGLINHCISNLVSPLRSKGNEVYEEKTEVRGEGKREEEEMEAGKKKRGGGGVINNLISNFFNQKEGEEEEEEEEESTDKNNNVDEEEKKREVVDYEGKEQVVKKKIKKDQGGGGIINTLVSSFPVSLPDDAAPAADEASILIHSIIHD